MKKLLTWFIILVIAIGFLSLNFIPSIRVDRLPVPFAENDQQLCTSSDSLCGCTQLGVSALGFPFRANLYDECGQEQGQVIWIAGLNMLIGCGFVFALYKLSRRK